MAYPIEGQTDFVNRTAEKVLQLEEAKLDAFDYSDRDRVEKYSDQVVYQDWRLIEGQRTGWKSRGYQEPYLAAQETRVRRFHETLNDYLDGNPPGRN